MKRLGVLGAGNHSSKCHGPALKLLAQRDPSRAELTAVCDLDDERARAYRQQFGFARAYADIAEMVEKERLDGLLVISPLALTESLVSSLLPCRIPLLIEKPPGKDSAATARLLAVARQHRTPHMVSFNRRYAPALQRALSWIAEAPVDRRPLFVLGRMLRHRRREADFVVETGLHLVDAVLAVLGPPARVSTGRIAERSRPTPTHKITPEESCYHYSARIAFKSGALADLIIAPDVGANEETYEIHGREYCIWIDQMNCTLRIRERNIPAVTWQPPADPQSPPGTRTRSPDYDGTLGEMEAFLAFLEDPKLRVPTLADALVSMRAAEAIATATDTDLSDAGG